MLAAIPSQYEMEKKAMGMEKKARLNSKHYTSNEKIVFLDVLKQYSGIIENKQTDKMSTKKKNAAWEKVRAQFNSSVQVEDEVSKAIS